MNIECAMFCSDAQNKQVINSIYDKIEAQPTRAEFNVENKSNIDLHVNCGHNQHCIHLYVTEPCKGASPILPIQNKEVDIPMMWRINIVTLC